MRTINKLTKLVLSFLLVITCINFSIVEAEDGSDENYSEPTAVETISEEPASEPEQELIPEEPAATEEIIVEEPVAEEPVVEEAAPVEEEKQEEVAPEVIEEAKVEEENNTPEIEAEPATQEETVEPEVQQEAPLEPEVEKVETVEEVKVTVVVSYVDESDHPLTDPITGSYPTEYRLDENVDAFKSFDGYAFEKVIVNDDAKNTISKDDVQKNGLRITKDMTSLKLVYQKMNLEFNESKEVIPEVTEEASEEAEPESNTNETELSAFDQTAFAGKVGVHASAAEGVLPKGARLIVEQVNRKAILNAVENTVSDNNKEMDSAVALDISIVDKDGNKIQPNGIVNITFVNTGVSGDEVKIYHVEDDASAVTEIANNTDSFDASHFSIYVIAGENQVPLATYKFNANGSVVSTQIVKTGDSLITPTAPEMNGKAFVGWYLGDTKFEDFNTTLTVTETKEIEINARYEDALYVYFYNPDGTKIMRTQKVADRDGHDYSPITYDVDATHKLVGWAAVPNGKDNIATNIAVPTDAVSTNVYAIIEQGYWVTFDSDGGSNIDSQFVLNGDKLTLNESTTPTKPGYTFDGWYDGSSKVENGATVTNPMTLKAHWEAKEVSYTVIHWWENADDDGYSFHESQELQGLTGETTAAVAKSYTTNGKNIHGESVNDKVFTASTISQKTIKGDGSTIVNVNYKRKTYTMHFKKKKSSSGDLSTITKKWGQSISKNEWPTYDGNGNWQIASSKYLAFTSSMPMNDSTLWSTSGYNTFNAYYYVQKVDGSGYDLHHTDTIKMNSYPTIGKEDCYDIPGYSYERGEPGVGGYYNNAKFYYTRNSYDLKFINNGIQDKTVTKKYEQSISGENYTPTRPSSLPEYYVFDGWYENELCEGEAYNFTGQKMPAQNITLYAKWTASDVKLTYNLNNPEGDVVKGTKKVEAGTIANTVLPSATTTSDYSFAGWYYADGNGNITSDAYNTNEAITKDTSVIGKWLYNGELKVVYDPGTEGTNAKVPTDSNIYAGGAKVTVAKNATTTSKKKFLGWQLNGKLYQPSASFEINKNLATEDVVTLTAIWGSEEASTTLTYNPGNGRGNATTEAILNNAEVTIESHGTLGFLAPEAAGKEYYFAGWATSLADATAGKATYSDSQTIRVDVNGENVLYATWVEKTVITLEAKVGTKTYNGQDQTIEGFKNTTVDGYKVSGLTAMTRGKDAQVYSNTVIEGTATVEKDGIDVTDKVVVRTVSGQLTINPRKVTLTSEGASKPYDGTALTKPDVKVTDEGFVAGEVSDIHATGSVTNVSEGEVTNTIIFTEGANYKASNYAITKNEGKLSITAITDEVTVTITGNTDTKTYDGNKHSVEGYTVSISKPKLYQENDITFTGSAKAEGTDADTYLMGLKVADFTNNNKNFTTVNFVVEDGKLVINKRQVTLTSASASKKYDGEALTKPDVTVTGDGFVAGEVSEIKAIGSVINVSEREVTNTITFKPEANYKADNYTIAKNEGKLSIIANDTEVTVTIKGNTDTVTYDGNSHSVEGYTVESISKPTLYQENNIKFTGNAKAEGTAAGTHYMNLSENQFSNANTNFANVTFTVTDGWLKVNPKSINPEDEKTGIKVTKPNDTMYNGEEQKNKPTVEDTKTGKTLTEGKDYTLSYSKDVTNAGKVEVTITGKGNYEGTANTSYQITKRNVTLTSGTASKVYDKQPLTKNEVAVSGNGFVKQEGATYKVTGSQTEVGSSKNVFTYELKSNTKASNYNITKVEGDLIVTSQDGEVVVTITGHTKTDDYDGTEKSITGYDVSITEGSKYTTSDFTFKGNAEAKGTAAGTYQMNLSSTQFSNTNTNFTKVRFIVTDGYLTINPKSIVPSDTNGIEVSKPSDSVYNGESHLNTLTVSDTKTDKTLKEGTDYTLSYSGDVVNVGTVTVTVKGIGNYTGEFTKTYEITPRPYTVTTESDEKVYDGTPLTAGGSIDGIVEGDDVEVRTTGRQTDVGESKNTYELVWKGAKKENYQLKEETLGTLKVTEQSIDPGKDPDNPNPSYVGVQINAPENHVYDGKDHQWIPEVLDKENQPLAAGTDYTVTYTDDSGEVKDDFRNVTGTIHVTISGKGNYTGSVTREYEITKRSVKLTSETDEKEFDGMPLTRPVVKIEGDGFVDDEVSDVKAIGTVTSVEESPVANKITYVTHEAFKYDNYNIELNEGTLTITPKSIIPDGPHTPDDKKTGITVENPADVKYDGKEHAEKPIVKDEKTGATLKEGKDYEIVYPEDIVNAGEITATVNGKGNYDGSFEIKYNILKRDVTFTSATDSKKYDGTALTNGNVEITGDGFAEGEGATFNVTGTITNTGSTENTFTFELNEGTLASNYNIEANAGTLTITPKSIIPDGPHTPDDKKTGITVENPADVKYDGKEHAQKPIVRDEKTGVTLEEGKDYEIVYPTDIKNAGTVTATVKGIGDYNGSFEIKYNILKRDVTFTSATDSKQYDGNAFTNGSVEITGDGFVEGEGVTFNVTGSITDAGSTKNTFTYVMHAGTNAGNYNVTVVEGTLTVTAAPVVPRQPETPQNPPARPSRPNVPARAETQPTTTTPAPEATVEPAKVEPTPAPTAKPEKIKEEATPQAAVKGHWALINLIAAMLSVVLAVAALLAKHAKEEDEEDKDDQVVESENQDDEAVTSKRHRTWKIVAVVDAIAAVVVFILTENLAHNMVLVDKWTVLMVLFGLISIVSTYFARKWHEEDEDEDEQSSQNA